MAFVNKWKRSVRTISNLQVYNEDLLKAGADKGSRDTHLLQTWRVFSSNYLWVTCMNILPDRLMEIQIIQAETIEQF